MHDGGATTAPNTTITPSSRHKPTLANLRDRNLDTDIDGTLEVHALKGNRRHFCRLARILGESFPIPMLTLSDLQGYVDRRAKARGQRSLLLPVTVRKEIITLRTWARSRARRGTRQWRYRGFLTPEGIARYPRLECDLNVRGLICRAVLAESEIALTETGVRTIPGMTRE